MVIAVICGTPTPAMMRVVQIVIIPHPVRDGCADEHEQKPSRGGKTWSVPYSYPWKTGLVR